MLKENKTLGNLCHEVFLSRGLHKAANSPPSTTLKLKALAKYWRFSAEVLHHIVDKIEIKLNGDGGFYA